MQKTIYSVSEAVRFLDIQSHVLRYWEEELRLPIGRNEMGHRYYTRWDIQIFMSIRELKKKGYALKEIGELTTLFYKNQVDEKQPEHRESAKKKKRGKNPRPRYPGNLWRLSANWLRTESRRKIQKKRGISVLMKGFVFVSSPEERQRQLWKKKRKKRGGFLKESKKRRRRGRNIKLPASSYLS